MRLDQAIRHARETGAEFRRAVCGMPADHRYAIDGDLIEYRKGSGSFASTWHSIELSVEEILATDWVCLDGYEPEAAA